MTTFRPMDEARKEDVRPVVRFRRRGGGIALADRAYGILSGSGGVRKAGEEAPRGAREERREPALVGDDAARDGGQAVAAQDDHPHRARRLGRAGQRAMECARAEQRRLEERAALVSRALVGEVEAAAGGSERAPAIAVP